MNQKALTCLITHGSLACCLKNVAEKLITPATDIYCFSNQEIALDEIQHAVEDLIAEQKPEKLILFVDLKGGSCWLLANRIKKQFGRVWIVAGVNVPMLVSYHMNYDRLPWPELIEKIVADGKKGIAEQ
ncbi:MAG TPA: hypothetical protein ENJ89_09870 [Caldithrix abyssi]|uniref:PTS EIIA type-4 domain-containing protein n=1 Tax=Caldithrix abyssi TaxID=187145 RepID=A0A7V5UFP2_CALAY|nr:hypothetical protein [Caldithrix abyssi]